MRPSIRPLFELLTVFALCAGAAVPTTTWAHTAFATSDTLPSFTFVGKARTSQEAETSAMALCDSEMRAGGFVPACRIFARGSGPGWYAASCGQLGCGVSYGQASLREAQEVAVEQCFKMQKFCKNNLTAYGEDLNVAPKKTAGTKK